MGKKKSEDKSQKNLEKDQEDSLQDVMAAGEKLRSPLLWGVLLFIPIALTLLVSVKDAPKENVAVESFEKKSEDNRITQESVRYKDFAHGISRGAKNVGKVNDCNFDALVGLPMSEKITEKTKSIGRVYRILLPDAMMTMDHSARRINFDINNDGIIIRVWCG